MQRLLNEFSLKHNPYNLSEDELKILSDIECIVEKLEQEKIHSPEHDDSVMSVIIDIVAHNKIGLLAIAAWDAYHHHPNSLLGKLIDHYLKSGWNVERKESYETPKTQGRDK